jgi:outer membrane protein OmpA-like peptidoglycan-associated protein
MRGRAIRHAADLARQGADQASQVIGGTADQVEGALTSITLPGGVHLSVPPGSIGYNLAAYLGSTAAAPKTFVFDHLNFESASANLTPESVPTVNALTTVLKAYPDSRVQLAGYTDNTGDPAANRRLSLDRANAVKSMLAQGGVAPDRIVAVGLGQDHPVSSNKDEDGRASNRRLELTVTSK